MKAKTFLKKTLLASVIALISHQAYSAGFQLHETSVSGLGRAFAGEAAVADNASVVATNPALMTLFKQAEFSLGGVYLDPTINVDGKINIADMRVKADNIAPNALVPWFYVVKPINDRFAIGGGVNVNFGLSTEFNNYFPAGFLGGKTKMKTLNTNFSGAYRFFDKLSVGLGVNVVYAKADLKRNVGVLPGDVLWEVQISGLKRHAHNLGRFEGFSRMVKDSFKVAMPPESTLARLTSRDTYGFGGNFGLSYDFNADHRLGLAYHSPVVLHMKGEFTNDIPYLLPPLSDLLNPIFKIGGIIQTAGTFIDGKMRIVLPEYVEFSGYHKLMDALALTYSAKWTKWDRLKELNGLSMGNKVLFNKKEYFRNSWRYALGAEYDLNSKWTLRSGLAYDRSASDSHRSISIPDTDRTWVSLGGTYRASERLSFDAGYSYIFGKKSHFIEDNGMPTASTFAVRSNAMIYGLNLNYKF